MDFKLLAAEGAELAGIEADALLLLVAEGTDAQALGPALGGALKAALKDGDLAYKAGRHLYLQALPGVKAGRVVFAAAAGSNAKAFRAALLAGLGQLKGGGARHLLVASALPQPLGDEQVQVLPQAVGDALYVYRHTKPSAPPDSKLQRVTLAVPGRASAALKAAFRRGQAMAAGVTLARECAHRPGNHCTPSYLAGEARRLAKAFKLEVQVLERKDVAKLGMGCFLAVAQASAQPLKFIVLQYRGAARNVAPLVLVGKGITFDTGGISIKPAAEMDEMKFDMGGAASVLGTFRAVAELAPRSTWWDSSPRARTCPAVRRSSPETWSPACRDRPWRYSTPMPRAG
jgi:leucyl aminopeptidase